MGDLISGVFSVLFVLGMVGSWFTHVFFCFAEAAWGFLIAGAILFPIAIVHGVYLWFQ